MARAWYKNSISGFLKDTDSGIDKVYAELNRWADNFAIVPQQKDAWEKEIELMRDTLQDFSKKDGRVYFEYEFPRIGRRADVVVVLDGCLYCFEFKVCLYAYGKQSYLTSAKDQVLDYAFDFADFNSKSHQCPIVPILVATGATDVEPELSLLDGYVYDVVCANSDNIKEVFNKVFQHEKQGVQITSIDDWENASYEPTPTIVQAAERLFENHKVEDISRSGSDVTGTISAIEKIIEIASDPNDPKRVVCFVTGEPGAGKTLVGLKLATTSSFAAEGGDCVDGRVFVSGNMPLVQVLQGALARDFYRQVDELEAYINLSGKKVVLSDKQRNILEYLKLSVKEGCKVPKELRSRYKGELCSLIYSKRTQRRFSLSGIKHSFSFKIQLVSQFRKGYNPKDLKDATSRSLEEVESGLFAPNERVVVFDEGQRAWDDKQIQKKDGKTCLFQVFHKMSEPEALLRYMTLRSLGGHDWCVMVVLVGNGQDIHSGEAGIKQWYKTLSTVESLKGWHICYANEGGVPGPDFLTMEDSCRDRINALNGIDYGKLHLKTSEREYRAPRYGEFVDKLLKGPSDEEGLDEVRKLLEEISRPNEVNGRENFFIRVTNNLELAKKWVIEHGHGTERRYGLLASSTAARLRHFGFYTISKGFDQEAWFLDGKDSINSSYAMEIAASEFKIQGLEIDYTIVGWDGDFLYKGNTFECRKFDVRNNMWKAIEDKKLEIDSDEGVADDGHASEDDNGENDVTVQHLINAYRVLLTRARQGMIIYIPKGDCDIQNISDENYAPTYKYLNEAIRIKELSPRDFKHS